MSHTALRPEALAMASHFLCVPLTYSNPLLAGAISLQAAASAAPPDLCPSSRTSTLLTKAEQHRTKAPRLLWRCLYDIYPFLHRPSPSGQRGQGRGEGCQPPYSIWSSSFTYYKHSPQGVINLTQQVHQVSSVGAGSFLIL